MREANFLRQNQERWQHYDTTPAASPDEQATRFISLTDDLAYAQTFYPASPTTAYLNALTGRQHQSLYKNKPEQQHRIGRFWAVEVPLVVARHWRSLAWAVGLFVLFTAIGALSAAQDENFVRLVLGDAYVNQTLANIRKGDPMAIYKSGNQTEMFVQIGANNIRVALLTFASGMTLGLGTLYLLFYNGVMLGSFQYFFYQEHVLKVSALSIWIHGTLEIPSIVVAGASGFMLAGSLLFPGTYSRRQSLARTARDAVKLALGLVPIILVAAFLESFVTRYTSMPLVASLSIIGGSAAFIIWYFGVYPWRLARHQRLLEATPLPLEVVA